MQQHAHLVYTSMLYMLSIDSPVGMSIVIESGLMRLE